MSSASAGSGQIVWLPQRLAQAGFTARDRTELVQWGLQYGRDVVLDDDPAAFAMLYEGSTPWASWAVARQEGLLIVWDCVTFADIGRFGCMKDALATLSGHAPGDDEPLSNVISFAAARLGRVCEECWTS